MTSGSCLGHKYKHKEYIHAWHSWEIQIANKISLPGLVITFNSPWRGSRGVLSYYSPTDMPPFVDPITWTQNVI